MFFFIGGNLSLRERRFMVVLGSDFFFRKDVGVEVDEEGF